MPKDVKYSLAYSWKKESYISNRKTEGMFGYFEDTRYTARVSVVNEDAPELPNMEFLISIGWEYLTTEISLGKDRVLYDFQIEDFNDEQLRQVVFFFDTLYGT